MRKAAGAAVRLSWCVRLPGSASCWEGGPIHCAVQLGCWEGGSGAAALVVGRHTPGAHSVPVLVPVSVHVPVWSVQLAAGRRLSVVGPVGTCTKLTPCGRLLLVLLFATMSELVLKSVPAHVPVPVRVPVSVHVPV